MVLLVMMPMARVVSTMANMYRSTFLYMFGILIIGFLVFSIWFRSTPTLLNPEGPQQASLL